MTRRGVFPGSFDPLTVAHLAIADAARAQADVDRVDLVVSRVALAKEHGGHSPVGERVETIASACDRRPWLGVVVTDAQLLVDIAAGYEVLIVGADKWEQVHDPAFYGGSTVARNEAVGRLPTVAVAPRSGSSFPDAPGVVVLDVPDWISEVSSTRVRSGREEWRA